MPTIKDEEMNYEESDIRINWQRQEHLCHAGQVDFAGEWRWLRHMMLLTRGDDAIITTREVYFGKKPCFIFVPLLVS